MIPGAEAPALSEFAQESLSVARRLLRSGSGLDYAADWLAACHPLEFPTIEAAAAAIAADSGQEPCQDTPI